MARRSKCDCPPPAPAWLTTFSDLMSLLMTFFVMLVAFATFEEAKIKEVIVSLKGAFGISKPGIHTITTPHPPFKQIPIKPPKKGAEEDEINEKRQKIQERLNRRGLDRTVGSKVTREGVVLVALSPVFFDPGSARIRPDAYETLSLIAEILQEYENDVRVEGHTSSATLELTSAYPTNWELSGARACAVLRYFVENHGVDPERMSYVGYGSTQPTVSNKTLQGRYLNDRIEIKLLTAPEPADIASHLITDQEEIPDDTETMLPVGEENSPPDGGPEP